MEKDKPKHSLAGRLTRSLLGTILIIMLLGTFLMVARARRTVTQRSVDKVETSVNSATKGIADRMEDVEIAVQTAASFADVFAHDKSKVYSLLQRLVLAEEDITAATMLYAENYFPKEGRYYAPTALIDENGSIRTEEIGGPENDFPYFETDSNWIYTNKKGSEYWCLPYMDSISTMRPMITYSVPIKDFSGNIYAVLCADVDLRWVSRLVDEYKPHPESEVSVLSRDGAFICHPSYPGVLATTINDISDSKEEAIPLHLARKMINGERGLEADRSPVFFAPVRNVEWAVSYTYPASEIMKGPNKMMLEMLAIILVMLLALAFRTYHKIERIVKPFTNLNEATKKVARGDFGATLPEINSGDEIQQLRDSFEEMQRSLVGYIDDLKKTTEQKAGMEKELSVAANIQSSILPKPFAGMYPDMQELDVFDFIRPAKTVGGDLYDYSVKDNKLFFCLGDVSGKGIPASLFMTMLISSFRNIISHTEDPTRVATLMNNSLSGRNDQEMFCTLFIGVLDLGSNVLRYCNAGHNPPVIKHIVNGEPVIEYIKAKANLPIGIMEGFDYTGEETTLAPGEFIFLYTDGVTEAEDADKKLFGEEATLTAVCESAPDGTHSAEDCIQNVYTSLSRHVNGAVQNDDITMLAVSRKA